MTKIRFITIACATALGFAVSGCAGFSPSASPGFAPAAAPATTATPKCPTDIANWLSGTGNRDMKAIYGALEEYSLFTPVFTTKYAPALPSAIAESSTAANDVAQALAHAPMPSDAGAALTDYTKALQAVQAGATAFDPNSESNDDTTNTDYSHAQNLLDSAHDVLQTAGCSVVYLH